MVELDRTEAMRLLASVSYGRVVFTQDALPAIRPINHLVDNGRVVVRTQLGAAVARAVRRDPGLVVVAYEADDIDPVSRLGWSVVITGWATTLRDRSAIARYERMLHPWVTNVVDTVLTIQPEIVHGMRLVPAQG
ncbi:MULTISPECIES: pyridoxamine 5'-phosphate oxidase family protein [Mycolicibacterium]|uniref:pyridoxamine 5'-phosphate oxidase family protein n=1 Tax=Mycolicibacterium TaxID=1866885 RepID=UPI00148FAC00|nr:pyridoxamine 5'-phosphate oxidase family protein [Mycolicibacterium fortuitum]